MPQIFSKWSNTAAKVLPIILLGLVGVTVFVFWYWFSPKNLEVGFRPEQPIPFSHKLHAGDLKIDCMYCHSMAEKSAYAGVPSTQTCMNCHEYQSNKDSLKLSGLMTSWNGDIAEATDAHGGAGAGAGAPIAWNRVHKVGDYAYFDHSAHVSAGVGCISCHGSVDQMLVVRQEKPLSMAWCLECHKNPAPHLRPVAEVTNMQYHQSESYKQMAIERAKSLDAPFVSCSGCHR